MLLEQFSKKFHDFTDWSRSFSPTIPFWHEWKPWYFQFHFFSWDKPYPMMLENHAFSEICSLKYIPLSFIKEPNHIYASKKMYRRKTLGLSNVDRIKKRKLLKSGFTPSKLNKTGCKILNLGEWQLYWQRADIIRTWVLLQFFSRFFIECCFISKRIH